jgi:prolipoprotein diacylglyceryltransferase
MKLNMGQWLSIPFVLLGIAGLYWSLKKKKRAVIIR